MKRTKEEAQERLLELMGSSWLWKAGRVRNGRPSAMERLEALAAAEELVEIASSPELQTEHLSPDWKACICVGCVARRWAERFGSPELQTRIG